MRVGQAVEGHRQKHRDGAGGGERARFRFAGVLQVIAGEGAARRVAMSVPPRLASCSACIFTGIRERARRGEQPLGLLDA